jgi:hypothetical protein
LPSTSLVKARLGPQRRVETDRGQNVAGQLKRIGFKTASAANPKHDPEKWMPVFGKDHAQTTS